MYIPFPHSNSSQSCLYSFDKSVHDLVTLVSGDIIRWGEDDMISIFAINTTRKGHDGKMLLVDACSADSVTQTGFERCWKRLLGGLILYKLDAPPHSPSSVHTINDMRNTHNKTTDRISPICFAAITEASNFVLSWDERYSPMFLQLSRSFSSAMISWTAKAAAHAIGWAIYV